MGPSGENNSARDEEQGGASCNQLLWHDLHKKGRKSCKRSYGSDAFKLTGYERICGLCGESFPRLNKKDRTRPNFPAHIKIAECKFVQLNLEPILDVLFV